MNEFLEDLQRYEIKAYVDVSGRLQLIGGDEIMRNYYRGVFENPENEIEAILSLAKFNEDILFDIQERAAIRAGDNLPGDLESAVRCNFENRRVGLTPSEYKTMKTAEKRVQRPKDFPKLILNLFFLACL